ncbi:MULTISPECIES: DUF4389 domain-containing protein [unclassified Streptomyces]|uniref:DUF4389 domain-containing protein n=1 Tax=unclassified Streptomyces TaxID=2593676 RepID=UPI002DDB5E97|nr:DUF4389 domain-containing protein [Streptomyces sp. NBC_01237]WRZ70690.1 DUF4389 domain-containing protein [Streptomyces sp. NBC_01237]
MADGQWSPGRVAGDADEFQPVVDIVEPSRQRRLTVLLRLLLLIPQFIVLFFLYIAAVVTVIVGWFAALVLGRLPQPVFRFLSGYLGYHVRVSASEMLLIDRYPPFALTPPPDYPVRTEVRATDLNRLAVLFRLFLMIPAAIVQSLAVTGWFVLGFLWWLITLVLGRMPRPLFEATAATLRYQTRFYAYAMMLTPAYPKGLFGDDDLSVLRARTRSGTEPLVMGGAGKALVVLFLVLGLLGGIGSSTTTWSDDGDDHRMSGQ